MKRQLAKIAFIFGILFAFAPSLTLAQATGSQTTTLLSLLSQVNALEQELSSLEATIGSLLGTATSTAASSTPIQALATTNILSNQAQPSCPALASYLGLASSQTCLGFPNSQLSVSPQSNADPVGALEQALLPPIAPPVTNVTNTQASSNATVNTPQLIDSTTPSYQNLFDTSCATAGATMAVSGGFSCIGICMPIPSSILECKSGTWQLQ